MSKLHISKMGLFNTPEHLQEIYDHVGRISIENGARADAMIAVGMTWNFIAEMIEAHNEFGGDAVSTGDE